MADTLRDVFWKRVYDVARKDRDVIVISADMGAPALDAFRRDIASQFVNVGISEQNGSLIASGLAMNGKHTFLYGIAPFVSLRILEQIRVESSIMNVPVTFVGVGVGFGYDDSGPTHHLIEDVAIMRAMPNIHTYSISDNRMSEAVAQMCCSTHTTAYVRLDRQPLPDLYGPDADFSRGFSVLREGRDGYIVAMGHMVHIAMELSSILARKRVSLGVVDLYRIPTDEKGLIRSIGGAKKIVTLEEHFLPAGMGSYVLEMLSDAGLRTPVKRLGLPHEKGYCYAYGGRPRIHEHYGVGRKRLESRIKEFIKP